MYPNQWVKIPVKYEYLIEASIYLLNAVHELKKSKFVLNGESRPLTVVLGS